MSELLPPPPMHDAFPGILRKSELWDEWPPTPTPNAWCISWNSEEVINLRWVSSYPHPQCMMHFLEFWGSHKLRWLSSYPHPQCMMHFLEFCGSHKLRWLSSYPHPHCMMHFQEFCGSHVFPSIWVPLWRTREWYLNSPLRLHFFCNKYLPLIMSLYC